MTEFVYESFPRSRYLSGEGVEEFKYEPNVTKVKDSMWTNRCTSKHFGDKPEYYKNCCHGLLSKIKPKRKSNCDSIARKYGLGPYKEARSEINKFLSQASPAAGGKRKRRRTRKRKSLKNRSRKYKY